MPFDAVALLMLGQTLGTVRLPEPPPKPDDAADELPVADPEQLEREPEAPSAPPPPEPAAEEVSASRRDTGFFFRYSLGSSFMALTHTTGAGDVETALEAGTISHELILGGTVAPGVSIGGRMAFSVAPDPAIEEQPDDTLDPMALALGSVILDVYPMPSEGLHLFLGGGAAMTTDVEPLAGFGYFGGTWTLGIGYEFWATDHWSVGLALRVDGVHVRADDDPSAGYEGDAPLPQLDAYLPGLQVSMTYGSGE